MIAPDAIVRCRTEATGYQNRGSRLAGSLQETSLLKGTF